jgi:hypothetical protein
MGRVIALDALEALNRETGRIKNNEDLVLGAEVSRDREYSEAPPIEEPRPSDR